MRARFRATGRSDRELLLASRSGKGGFEAFFCRHREAVLAFHARRVREPEAAADLMSETFAAALLAVLDQAREIPETPVAWLFTIAHRKLIDSYRRGQVDDDARRRLRLEPLLLEDADIERIAEIENDTDVVAELARQLPTDQFEALRARVLDERGYPDIASELGCSPGVVRMRVSRALNTLRNTTEARND
jgi:RNA polymerase sigma-70 factor (ECF subfamily)